MTEHAAPGTAAPGPATTEPPVAEASQPFHQDGHITLYHGDCALLLPALRVQADLIITSPPYDDLRNYDIPEFDFPKVAEACLNAS